MVPPLGKPELWGPRYTIYIIENFSPKISVINKLNAATTYKYLIKFSRKTKTNQPLL